MSIYENKWHHVNTFEELCFLGALYVNDIIKNFPTYGHVDNRKNLYELTGEFEWIQPIIYEYNLLNYFTDMSQPGKCDIIMDDTNIKYEYYQRACVSGFIDKEKATYIYDKMITNEHYRICIEDIYETDDEIYDLCSIYIEFIEIDNKKYYINNDDNTLISTDTFNIDYNNYVYLKHQPVTCVLDTIKTFKYFNKTAYIENIDGDYIEIINGDYIKTILEQRFGKHLLNLDTKYYNKYNDSYVVYMCVMDRRWNYNDEFWSDLLKYLKEYDEIKN